jgi:hypothetical protein
LKTFGIVAVAILVAFGAGWLLGASGKASVSAERRALEERATIAEARLALIDARANLEAKKFDDVPKELERARELAADLQVKLRETSQPERAGHLEIVLAHVRDAQRMTAAQAQSAQDAVTQAIDALKNLAPSTARRAP